MSIGTLGISIMICIGVAANYDVEMAKDVAAHVIVKDGRVDAVQFELPSEFAKKLRLGSRIHVAPTLQEPLSSVAFDKVEVTIESIVLTEPDRFTIIGKPAPAPGVARAPAQINVPTPTISEVRIVFNTRSLMSFLSGKFFRSERSR